MWRFFFLIAKRYILPNFCQIQVAKYVAVFFLIAKRYILPNFCQIQVAEYEVAKYVAVFI